MNLTCIQTDLKKTLIQGVDGRYCLSFFNSNTSLKLIIKVYEKTEFYLKKLMNAMKIVKEKKKSKMRG